LLTDLKFPSNSADSLSHERLIMWHKNLATIEI